MSTQINFYELLGVKTDADESEIKRAYRRLAAKTHPDVGGEAMEPLFIGVQKAYETLSDPVTRAEYDRKLQDPQERTERRSRAREDEYTGQNESPRTRTGPPPSYEWDWISTIAPMEGKTTFPIKPSAGDGKRIIRERYTQRFPFLLILSISMLVWVLSIVLRQTAGIPDNIDASALTKMFGAFQLAHVVVTVAALFAKKNKALKTAISAVLGLIYVLAPSFVGFTSTRTPDFIAPTALGIVATITAVGASIALVWSLHEQRARALKLKHSGLPRKVGDWNVINVARLAVNSNKALSHAQTIAEMVASKLPGTKILLNLPGRAGARNSMVVINGNRIALVEVMDVSMRDIPDDITTFHWKEFPWGRSTIGDKPLILKKMLPQNMELRTFFMVYPAHTGAHYDSYRMGDSTIEVTAVSDVELGNQMGQWLADGEDAGAVDKDLFYGLLTRKPLSTFV